ncbi:MAG: 1-acyl-sn-glycerol-3-phosphate acyltransferase [Muribaculaceae bacterium]|nr:1-acyl-sn-glycerol-3-phosphate acyltransferase [Muribaculaceae bacterium]MBQ9073716.1 1-acyl-sn-glycerol-3-phosphate acyltransferase [Muribaculaceae bacterium]
MKNNETPTPDTKKETSIKRNVLDCDDVTAMIPKLKGHEKLINRIFKWLSVDKVNDVHSRYCDNPGVPFACNLLKDFDITLDIDRKEVLQQLPEGAFITVSNHPFGALEGISLIAMIGSIRPTFKVMVNMILNHIGAMRPNFIAVDAHQSDDPDKKAVSMRGMKEAIVQVRRGHPVGFFPAGAVSKVNWRLQLEDREWQPAIIRLIQQLKVPVVPIYWHGSNSWWFNFLGVVCWQLRTLRMPAEVWRKCHSTMRVSIGNIISVEELQKHESIEDLRDFLRSKTYELRNRKK